jgi:hypothetical protein
MSVYRRVTPPSACSNCRPPKHFEKQLSEILPVNFQESIALLIPENIGATWENMVDCSAVQAASRWKALP